MRLKISSALAEETGIHIGDGSMNLYNNKGKKQGLFQLRGHLKDDSEYYKRHIARLYEKVYGIKVRIRKMPSTGVIGFQLWSTPIVEFKNNVLGLPLGKKRNIRIPEICLMSPKFRIDVIRGVFDTDGCLYLENKRGKKYPIVQIRNTSEILAGQISGILKEFGFGFGKYIIRRKNPNWKPLYSIVIRGKNMTNRFFELVKPSNPKHLKKFKLLNA